ncbi:hypothetical protein C496_11403 [Natronorubrum tibetense GA33]|uniref:Uncharacterized protein n=2 Tax=Natronorubrum tibetense TaxID=63128 RepID=L9VU05_9EURY|nr:hypothetical protein C496_11403 [Natronorubrum tibetense GA33]
MWIGGDGVHMEQNIIERNFIVRFFVGLGVILMMAYVGEQLGLLLLAYGFPYGGWVGVAIGMIVVFIAFAAVYTLYCSIVESE